MRLAAITNFLMIKNTRKDIIMANENIMRWLEEKIFLFSCEHMPLAYVFTSAGDFLKNKLNRPAGLQAFCSSSVTLLVVNVKVFVSSGSFGTGIALSSNVLLAPLLLKSCGGMLFSEEGSSGWNA